MTFAASLPIAAAEPGAESTQAPFENSCSPAVQAEMTRGFTLLHCFEYPETTRIFGAILEREPGCAMAYWGAAMSHWHPLWAPSGSVTYRRSVLEKYAACCRAGDFETWIRPGSIPTDVDATCGRRIVCSVISSSGKRGLVPLSAAPLTSHSLPGFNGDAGGDP